MNSNFTISSTVDYVTLAATVKAYARGIVSAMRGGTHMVPIGAYAAMHRGAREARSSAPDGE